MLGVIKVNVTLYESDTLFDTICDEWNTLLADSAADQIFLTCEWQSTWWKAYHPGQFWVLLVRDDAGRLQGVAPWFIDETEEPDLRVVRTIGCVDVTDYLDVVARRGVEEAVFSAVADFLAAHSDRFDEARLCNIPHGSRALEMLPDLLKRRGLAVDVMLQEVCPVVILPETWPDYIATLDKKNRHELRRKVRRAAGSVDWYIAGPEHDLMVEMEQFIRLMAASSEEKRVFLQNAQNRTFFELMVPVVAARGWLQLAFLTVDGVAAAAYLNFEYNNRVLVYNSGHDPAAHGHLSPGIVLLARLIEHAIEQRRTAFDFLRGDEPYKYDMGGKDTGVFQMRIRPRAGG